MEDFYKVGGSLKYDHPTYIKRQADRDIYLFLKQKEFCYVLNSRQMGKSSLRVRTMKTLAKEGFKCITIDLGILGRFATAEQWYGGLASELWRRLRLSSGINDDLTWWRSHLEIPPVQRFLRFIEDIVLAKRPEDIIIFLDEIDNIINLDFRDEFFILIRNCYEKRVEYPEYCRLTFCLLGVATPSNLRNDKQLNPFDIGRAIQLTGFNFSEAQPLVIGLQNRFNQPKAILKEILYWTQGQPFLTQKICSLTVRYSESKLDLPQLIQRFIIDNWEIQDEPEHLKTIRNRLLQNQHQARLLSLLSRIHHQRGMRVDDSDEQLELRLSGLITADRGKLKIANPIYQKIFNQSWVAKQLADISPYQNAIAAWLKSDGSDKSRLLRGEALREGQNWAKKHSITKAERDFLRQSEAQAVKEERQAQLAQKAKIVARQLAQEKKLVRWQRLFMLFSLAMITGFYLKSRQANLSNINALVQSSEALLASNQKLDALIAAIKAQQQLNKSLGVNQNLTQRVEAVLQQVAYNIEEYDRLIGHTDRLHSIAVSPQGNLIATAATDNTVRLWNKKAAGWQLTNILHHEGWVVDVAINAKGEIASASRDRTVKLWNSQGKLLDTLQHSSAVTSVAFKPNNQIVTGSEDGTIKIWQRGKAIKTLTGHTAAVEAIAINPQEDKIISGSEDGTIKIWQRGKVIKTLTGHTDAVRAIAITPDGDRIISGSRDKTLKIWNNQGTVLATLTGHLAPVYGVAINPQNQQIISASGDKTLKVWDFKGTEITTLKGHTNRVWDVAVTPDGRVASASWDRTARLWQLKHNFTKTLSAHQDVAIALDYDADLIASASDDKTVRLWNPTGTLLKTFRQHTAEVYDVAVYGQAIASVGADKTLKLWQAKGSKVQNIAAHNSAIWAVAIHPQGNKIITGGNDNQIKIWDFQGNLLLTLRGHTQKVWDLAIHPHHNLLVSASEDRTLKIWDFNGSLLHTFRGHKDAVRTVAFSPDGSQIISGSEDRSIKVWDLQGNTVATLNQHHATVKGVAVSPNNQYLASVSDEGKIILWRKHDRTWIESQTLQGHHNSIWSVAFSPNSKTLATAGEEGKIKLWNLANMIELDPLEYGCDWLNDYLSARQQYKYICQGK